MQKQNCTCLLIKLKLHKNVRRLTLFLSLGIRLENLAHAKDTDGATNVAQGHFLLRIGDQSQRVSVAKIPHRLSQLGRVADEVREGASQRCRALPGR